MSDCTPTISDKNQLLHEAVRSNNPTEVENSLSLGAQVDALGERARTPLLTAAFYNESPDSHLRVFELLLKSGANADARDQDGKSALFYLVYHNNPETIKLLLDHNATVNTRDHTNMETALFFAVRGINYDNVKLLVDRGSDVNALNKYGKTPLHCAFVSSYKIEIAKYLLKNGAELDSTMLVGMLELHSNETSLKFLLKHSDVNYVDPNGNHLTSFKQDQDTWRIILKHLALLRALDLQVDPVILNGGSYKVGNKKYFEKCVNELTLAKATKVRNTRLTYFNLLVDGRRKLKNYGGNKDLVRQVENSCFGKFRIYGAEMRRNVEKGIKARKAFDESCGLLSDCLPTFGPDHLVVRDVLDCLTVKDYVKFVSED